VVCTEIRGRLVFLRWGQRFMYRRERLLEIPALELLRRSGFYTIEVCAC
jgi:hypothetical protein